MNEIPDGVRQAILDGEALASFRESPGHAVVEALVRGFVLSAFDTLMACKESEMVEARGRLRALMGVMDGLHGSEQAARELAAAVAKQALQSREPDRADDEQAAERGYRQDAALAFGR